MHKIIIPSYILLEDNNYKNIIYHSKNKHSNNLKISIYFFIETNLKTIFKIFEVKKAKINDYLMSYLNDIQIRKSNPFKNFENFILKDSILKTKINQELNAFNTYVNNDKDFDYKILPYYKGFMTESWLNIFNYQKTHGRIK